MAHLIAGGWLPKSQPEKSCVREQLRRLFAHHAFKNSKRCQALLSYIVDHHLDDGACHLKERTLGTEVFGRDADYDTNVDPVVRTTASEIRKRIAQYYHEPGHENEIRIELPLGSYIPEFYLPSAIASDPETSREPSAPSPTQYAAAIHRVRRPWGHYAISACVLAVLIGLVSWRELRRTASTLNQFWSPIASSSVPVQLCVGTWPRPRRSSSNAPTASANTTNSVAQPALAAAQVGTAAPGVVAWPDMLAISNVVGFLEVIRKKYRVENSKYTTINNLTQGPTVLLAAFNNQWTLGVTGSLRFHFMRENNQGWIADRKNPSKHYSQAPGTLPGSVRDFAIIGRFRSGTTGQVFVVAAGLGAAGTIAASQFVTSRQDMKSLVGQLPKDWRSKNIEVLISVVAVNGEPGAPSIQAAEVW